ncbi:FMN-binding split barrel-like protein [Penicillium citrinum]|uniref:FMN-binding split barrel-like protein n=1 Tax=Penicillium citrinum TaxID=5077 RepID=A0A9W9NRF7_PENCI|nr:FMN-binding split barrel-like protein [Penicillium citrinum]KAJ5224548.1 FMN-binding split barrel-like protein [Penicillium citrinum]
MKLSLAPAATRRCIGDLLYPKGLAFRSWRPSHILQTQQSLPRQHLSQRQFTNATASQSQASHASRETPLSDSNQSNESSPQSATLHSTSTPSISESVRLLMRRVPYPVAIITATDPSAPSDTTAFRGMTVSSFSTVTLTPHPVISFNVRRPSETLNALLSSGRFLVHLLAPSPATATLARDFSKGNTTLASMLSGHGDFEFNALTPSRDNGPSQERPLPILRRRGKSPDQIVDFPFVFECTLHPSKIDVHDHSIVLGTVVRAIECPGASCSVEQGDEHSPDHLCLTYANTRFWKMGSEI